METFINLFAFIVLGALWLAFVAALLLNRESLERAWQRFRSWPLIVQLLVWVLALPVVLGLWIWQMRWPVALRLILVAALAWMTLYTFFPRAWLA